MKLIVGLGNPGSRYVRTRHNVGFMAVERIARHFGIGLGSEKFSSVWGKGGWKGQELGFLLPQTFMNLSGDAVRAAAAFYKVEVRDLLVAHDDLDLVPGRVKLGFDSGDAGHKGVRSTIAALGTQEFFRARIGIGRPERKEEVESYVLSPFQKEETTALEGALEEIQKLVERWIMDRSKEWPENMEEEK